MRKNPLFKVITATIGLGTISLSLFTICIADIVRARVINVTDITRRFEAQRAANLHNPNFVPKVFVARGLDYHKEFDFRCISWATQPVASSWSKDSKDSDFVLDYYLPPNKNAIICTSPLLAIALKAKSRKPFIYEASPTHYGMRIRINMGLTEARDICQKFTGNINCANAILFRQASVKYEP